MLLAALKRIRDNVRLLVPRKQRDVSRVPGRRLGMAVSRECENPRRIYLLNYMIKELENECSRSAKKDS